MSDATTLRTQGIGANFTVDDPADGYRQNNQVWVGTCRACGERVTSSLHDDGVWMHKKHGPDGNSYREIDHCPKECGCA